MKILLLIFSLSLTLISQSYGYSPEKGDLYFQDLNCGKLCDAITNVTYGYGNTEISHVAMLVKSGKNPLVIEAIGKNVHITSLKSFLSRSKNKKGNPMVIVGRLKNQYRHLIPQAINQSIQWLGLPYNENFIPNKFKSFYCSQLIYDAFMLANKGNPIFKNHKMTYKVNGKTLPAWKSYFKSINLLNTEGLTGTNPGMMSRSSNINIIYAYGKLRKVV